MGHRRESGPVKTRIYLGMFCCFVVFSPVSLAAIYKCTKANGEVAYSQTPCSDGAVKTLPDIDYSPGSGGGELPVESLREQKAFSREQAAEETELEHIQLLGAHLQSPFLTNAGVILGYVSKDTRPGTTGKYYCGALSRKAAIDSGKMIARSMQRMSARTIEKTGLKYVLLCNGAKKWNRRIGGIPVAPLRLLMMDATGNASYSDHILMHEFYHFAEIRLDDLNDSDWNDRFDHGYAGSFKPSLLTEKLGSGQRGFASAYSMTLPEEERAELFAHLMIQPSRVVRLAKSSSDAVLLEKIEFISEKVEDMLGLNLTTN